MSPIPYATLPGSDAYDVTSPEPASPAARPALHGLSNGRWDVIVVGAGPAGSAAALTLARNGRRVLLVDKARFPRDKVCGDALIPDALRCLERLGLLADVRRLGHAAGILSLYSASRERLDVPSTFLTVKRGVFDHFLVGEAVRAGATLARARVDAVDTASDGAFVCVLDAAAGGPSVEANAGLVTTGASVELLARHGLVTQPRASGMALRCYVRSDERIDELVISYDREIAPGYAWIFPLGGGEYNVGCGTVFSARYERGMNLRRDFEVFTSRFPLARALMARASEVTRLEGAMLRCGLRGTRPVGPGRALSAGEAIGATFPFTGEGIGKAMETGVLAAEALDAALAQNGDRPLAAFTHRLQAELAPKYLGYSRAERWLEWPRVGDFVIRTARRSAFMREAIIGILDERVDPRTVFSVRGVLHAILGRP